MKMFNKFSVVAFAVVSAIGFVGPMSALAAGPAPINLGSIETNNFVILAETGITDVPTSAITGNIGNSGGTGAQIGVTCAEITGSIYTVDALAAFAGGPGGSGDNSCVMAGPGANKTLVDNAVSDMGIAYTNASDPATPAGVGANLNIGTPAGTVGAMTLAPGVYTWGSNVTITDNLTLSGGANDVWVFQISGTLDLAAGKSILLTGGAQAKNVFWRVAGTVNLLAGSHMQGIILAQTDIAFRSLATLNGRALAQTAVTLIANSISLAVVPPVITPATVYAVANYEVPLPLINITKVPSPLALPLGAGPVTYTYKLSNIGIVGLTNTWLTVKDDSCDPVKFISGDTNNNSVLDPNETWVYTCTKTLSKTETNIVTAHGSANGWDVYDTASATVVVAAPLTPPLIHLVKTPSTFILPSTGGPVTYTYTVTNPGTEPLNDVVITDDKCTGLPGRVLEHPGDLNKNDLLESNETWTFTCQSDLTQTTMNTGTATGHANGFTAVDTSLVTVVVTSVAPAAVVTTPKLPNTGFGLGENGFPWKILAGILALAAVLFYVFKGKKQTV